MGTIIFLKGKKQIEAKEGTELATIYKTFQGNLPFKFGCLKGECGTCLMKVVEGDESLSKPTKQECATLKRLKSEDKRLACQCALLKGKVTIDL